MQENNSEILLYQTEDGQTKIDVRLEEEMVWLTQKTMGELFGVTKKTISEHLSNIYKSGELEKEATVRKIRTVQNEGEREVVRNIDFYNLDAIISVGYRVNSQQATQFRIWATKTFLKSKDHTSCTAHTPTVSGRFQ